MRERRLTAALVRARSQAAEPHGSSRAPEPGRHARLPGAMPVERGGRDERGSVTAELAVTLPAVVMVVALAAGSLSCAAAQVRLQDGAADAARLVARGDAGRAAAALSVAVSGASHGVTAEGDLVCVTARASVGFGPVSVPLEARSCALEGGL